MSARTINLNEQLYTYYQAHAFRDAPALKGLREATLSVHGAQMQVSPEQGQFMQFLIRLTQAKRIIELGTFTGYSALAMALVLPDDGKLITCDINEGCTKVGRPFWQQAGVEDKITVEIGLASEIMDGLIEKGEQFDLAFVDADKRNYPAYFEHLLKLVRKGGLILVDNTLWGGKVADDEVQDPQTQAIRAFNDKLLNDNRVEMAFLPIGDGLSMARVL